jgi:hypothetical protein
MTLIIGLDMYILSPIRDSRCLTYDTNHRTRHVHTFILPIKILLSSASLSRVISVSFCHMIIYLISSLSPVPLHLAGCICTCAGQRNLRHELKITGQSVKDFFVDVHALKWVEVWLHSLLTSTLDGHKCSALRPGRSTPSERISCTHLEGNWMSSRTSLDIHIMLTGNRTTIPWSFITWTCR